ncbi:uncharacterized protein SPPG_00359 [Spizellomyces punctatus DAOM BR117]|uniref:Enoyl reductase (ER) domain-containing protein n=1 Tax=Spizellomyces punctatus (strain DAOM BR117) TaxID=645134 RepID=A0A0L0HU64_SPIPD|nr:uncharacterized protein SPPG_00359 [Spizellomyces punctatus DAOM BR117]KND04643.1 hypothetical protein SPPG_00359 [Spizellomyces punctatus DAOM BR117]|eukprot:XP_016612682.1 hypothetical protein SPPG_00359 [Spizellomyces punctatus DAOM BR117]
MQALTLAKPVTSTSPKYDPLELKTLPVPTPSASETLVRIHAAALNHRDVFIRQGLYPKIKYGSILGSDGAGVEVESGKRVLINPSMNWASDPRGPEQPEKYGMLGLLPFPGTFAEYICIPKTQVHPIPAHLTFTQAAALPLAGLTAWRATMTKGQVQPHSTVLITGVGGGVALFAMQFAVAAGAKVFVTSSDPAKIEKAIEMGATGGVNYREENWAKTLLTLTGGQVDTVIDSAGGEASLAAYLKLLCVGGKLVTYGATVSPTASLLLPTVFLKQISILGTTMGNQDEFKAMLEFVERHRIVPVVSDVWEGLSEGEGAFECMRKAKQFGKLVIRVRPDDDSNGPKL